MQRIRASPPAPRPWRSGAPCANASTVTVTRPARRPGQSIVRRKSCPPVRTRVPSIPAHPRFNQAVLATGLVLALAAREPGLVRRVLRSCSPRRRLRPPLRALPAGLRPPDPAAPRTAARNSRTHAPPRFAPPSRCVSSAPPSWRSRAAPPPWAGHSRSWSPARGARRGVGRLRRLRTVRASRPTPCPPGPPRRPSRPRPARRVRDRRPGHSCCQLTVLRAVQGRQAATRGGGTPHVVVDVDDRPDLFRRFAVVSTPVLFEVGATGRSAAATAAPPPSASPPARAAPCSAPGATARPPPRRTRGDAHHRRPLHP